MKWEEELIYSSTYYYTHAMFSDKDIKNQRNYEFTKYNMCVIYTL